MTTTAPCVADDADRLIAGYEASAAETWDEMMDARGRVRPHWRPFLDGLAAMSDAERHGRAARLDRRVRDTGIAYDIFADPRRSQQRWTLDLAPIVFSQAEWRWLDGALTQRARLFDRLLADIYGPQTTMRTGLLPPEIVFSDSAFLRPCQDILPNAGGLTFYAADLARGADGRWRVIDNHTETLAGVGFALANRVVHTHVAGDLFKQANAVRLAAYFERLQAALRRHAGRDNARIALLTPGPHHEDYFSHAYLARYLGYLLVEGPDLRTRGSRVHQKTLEGLKEIDLIVRCVDGRACDPLELDPSGFDGPAGLLRIWRSETRLVVNAIGSAVVQNRGLGAALPTLARQLFNEELALELNSPSYGNQATFARPGPRGPARHTHDRFRTGRRRPGRAALG